MTLCDWPASMSKSTPTRPGDAHRPTKVWNPVAEPQVNDPAAPPVETMYLMPAFERSGTFTDARVAPSTPAQFSLPHSPVANASVIVLSPAIVRSLARAVGEPETFVWMTFVFQFMLMLV